MNGTATNRRLATILFADIDGYTRLMRADEERTFVDLRAHLAELVGPNVERFRGRIVKTVGDGVLVEFASAVEAVRSAVELQRGMVERNVGLPVERRQAFRIGLHLGDIIASDDDVFGDTVNVAARLQGLAEPGSIVLSASVHEQVRDKLALRFRALGSRVLKNIDRPLQLFALDAAALSETTAPERTPSRRRIVAVALGAPPAPVRAQRRHWAPSIAGRGPGSTPDGVAQAVAVAKLNAVVGMVEMAGIRAHLSTD